MSSARSGSTLLDIILGNSKNAKSIGEVNRYPRRRGKPPARDPEDDVAIFWDDFSKRLQSKNHDYKNLERLDFVFESHEHFSSIYRRLLLKNSDKFLYRNFISSFYNTIHEMIDNEFLVESSKYPLRAYWLSKLYEGNVSYIYLKKDSASVVRSLCKKNLEQPSKGFLTASMYTFASNLYCTLVYSYLKLKGFKILKIQLEELINNPEVVLLEIKKKLNLQLDETISDILNDKSIRVGNLFDGNRIRLEESIKLQRSVKTPKDLQDYIVRFMNLPFY